MKVKQKLNPFWKIYKKQEISLHGSPFFWYISKMWTDSPVANGRPSFIFPWKLQTAVKERKEK